MKEIGRRKAPKQPKEKVFYEAECPECGTIYAVTRSEIKKITGETYTWEGELNIERTGKQPDYYVVTCPKDDCEIFMGTDEQHLIQKIISDKQRNKEQQKYDDIHHPDYGF